MVFGVYFFIGWLMVFFFYAQKKNLSLYENTTLLLILLVVNIHWSWFVYEEYKLIKLSEKPMDYTAFILNRSIIIPLIALIYLNFVTFNTTIKKFIYLTLLFSFFLLISTIFALETNVITYKKWFIGYDYLYYLGFTSFAYFLHSLYQRVIKKEVTYT